MTSDEPSLANVAPGSRLADFARHPLIFGPSPVHRLDRLTAHLDGAAVWAKRDDCNSGLAYGGNKTRKLEYLVADALAQGCDTLVSIGGVQSNHTRQVAAAAAQTGMGCVLVQESWVDWPDVVYDRVGNIQLSRIMGADVRLVQAGFGIGFKQSWERALADVEAAGGKPYAIPAGASDHPLGGLGFASWACEVEQQERELGVFFDTIIVCSVTGSTQAGMIAGFAGQRARAARHRDRRLGQARRDARPGRPDRPEDRRADRRRARPARRRDHPGRPLPRRHLRHPGRADARGDPAGRTAGGHDHRPRLRGEVDGRTDRPRRRPRDRSRRHRALRAPRRPARAERLRRPLPQLTRRPAAGSGRAAAQRAAGWRLRACRLRLLTRAQLMPTDCHIRVEASNAGTVVHAPAGTTARRPAARDRRRCRSCIRESSCDGRTVPIHARRPRRIRLPDVPRSYRFLAWMRSSPLPRTRRPPGTKSSREPWTGAHAR